jgi:hypothetical protein
MEGQYSISYGGAIICHSDASLISQLVKLTRFGIYEDLWKREKLPKPILT